MNKVKQKIFNKITKSLFNGITEDDVLVQRKDGVILYKGKPLPDEIRQGLQEEAQRFRHTRLWQIMKNDMKYLANDRIYNKSSKPDDWIFGKTTLYVIQTLDKLLIRISNFRK